MGVVIRLDDVEFENYVGVADYPILSSLKNLYYMGGSAELSLKDNSGNKNNGTAVGTITYNASDAVFADTATANKVTAQEINGSFEGITVIGLFKISGDRAIVSAGGNGSVSDGMLSVSPSKILYCSDTDTNLRNINISLPSSNNYYIEAWVIEPTGHHVYIDYLGSGLTLIQSGTGTGNSVKVYKNNTKKLVVGGSAENMSLNGTMNLAMCAFYNAAITQDQIKDAVAFMRVYGERKGFTIN